MASYARHTAQEGAAPAGTAVLTPYDPWIPMLGGTLNDPLSTTTQAGASYTLAAVDAGTCVEFTNASAVTVTIPLHAVVPIPVGAVIEVCSIGVGGMTIVGATGVNVRSLGSLVLPRYGSLRLRKRDFDDWVVTPSVLNPIGLAR